MAQKFEISLDFGRIQIVPKNGIFNHIRLHNKLLSHFNGGKGYKASKVPWENSKGNGYKITREKRKNEGLKK